ncbi:hypothetical protein ACI65C_004475 [Semiaphis heraclei]
MVSNNKHVAMNRAVVQVVSEETTMSLDKINIEELSPDELFEIFDSIPSDDDSICDDLLDKDENAYTVEINNYKIN